MILQSMVKARIRRRWWQVRSHKTATSEKIAPTPASGGHSDGSRLSTGLIGHELLWRKNDDSYLDAFISGVYERAGLSVPNCLRLILPFQWLSDLN